MTLTKLPSADELGAVGTALKNIYHEAHPIDYTAILDMYDYFRTKIATGLQELYALFNPQDNLGRTETFLSVFINRTGHRTIGQLVAAIELDSSVPQIDVAAGIGTHFHLPFPVYDPWEKIYFPDWAQLRPGPGRLTQDDMGHRQLFSAALRHKAALKKLEDALARTPKELLARDRQIF